MATADEIRRLREETSIFSRLFDLARQQGESLEQEGRRPVLGGLLSKEPVMGTDTIRYEGITPLLLNLIEPIARGIDAPRAAAQNLIPQEDMIGEAFGTAGTAMIGGGLAAKPSGSLGANMLLSGKMTDPTETGWTFRDVKKPNLTRAENREVYEALSVPRGYEVELPIRRLFATQDKVNPDFDTTTSSQGFIPTVIRKDGEFFIRDGHHRLTKQAEAGNQTAKVFLYDLDKSNRDTPLLDYKPPRKLTDEEYLEIERLLAELDAPIIAANASKSTGLLSVASDVAERGDQILNMLKSGRADDITDSMFDMRDLAKNTQLNQYLFENYDLPMDKASRMARAREMGFDVDNVFYHGTDADFLSASADMGAVDRYKTGFYSSDNPNIAETYAPRDGGKIIPVLTRNDPDMIIDAKGSNWNQLEFDLPTYSSQMGDEDLYSYFFNMFADNDMEPLNTNAIARQRRFEGDSSVMFENLVDRGGVYPYGDTSLANFPSNIRTDFYPSSLRSKFARFDPRLRNNENLLAANASPISGILAQSGVSENQAQRIEDYLRKRGLLD